MQAAIIVLVLLLQPTQQLDCDKNDRCAICNIQTGYCKACHRESYGLQMYSDPPTNSTMIEDSYACIERAQNVIEYCVEYTHPYSDSLGCSRCDNKKILSQTMDYCISMGLINYCGVRCNSCWDVYNDFDQTECLDCELGFTNSVYPPYRDCGNSLSAYELPIENCQLQMWNKCVECKKYFILSYDYTQCIFDDSMSWCSRVMEHYTAGSNLCEECDSAMNMVNHQLCDVVDLSWLMKGVNILLIIGFVFVANLSIFSAV